MIKRTTDGGIWLPRANPLLEKQLNQTHVRAAGSKFWYPPPSGGSVESLRDCYKGKQVQIIGKGESILRLSKLNFGDGPIICINESIQFMDNLDPMLSNFVLQYDGGVQEKCWPKFATLLLGTPAKGWYAGVKNKILFDPKDFNTEPRQLSAVYAMYFAKLMGCVSAKLIAFDAAINGSLTYPNLFGYVEKQLREKRAGERFLTHRKKLESAAYKLNLRLEWLCP